MARAPKFFSMLPEPRETAVQRLEAYARDPSRTIEQCHTWLMSEYGFVDSIDMPDHPMALSKSAVGRWKQNFDALDALSVAASFVDSLEAANDENGAIDLGKGARLIITQQLVNNLAEKGGRGDIDYLEKAAATIERLTRTGRHSVKLEQEFAAKERAFKAEMDGLKKASATRAITPEEIEAASKRVFG